MSTAAFLSYLRKLDIVLRVEGGQIQVSGPKTALTPDLREQLTQRKSEILAFLADSMEARSDLSPIEAVSRDGSVPLSFAQMRLWFLEQLAPGNSAYIIPMAAQLKGKLDFAIVEKSLSEIVRRHETLRTAFPPVNGSPEVVIGPPASLTVRYSDLASLLVEERDRIARGIGSEIFHQPFDLAAGPLIRAAVLRLEENVHALLVGVHHAVFDQWSVGIFWREFCSLYTAFRADQRSPLPELNLQYGDFAAWQRRRLEGPARETHLAFWKQQLDGCPQQLDLPTDWPRAELQMRRSASKFLRIDPATYQALKTFSQQEGASLFMILLAAFNILLGRWSGQDDILMGTPIAGRNRVELEDLVGFFINTVVIRTRLSSAGSFRDLLAQVRNTTLDAHMHQEMPFEELVDALRVQRDPSRTPLFQVFFNHMNISTAPWEIPGLEMETTGDFDVDSKFDLTLYSTETDGSIHLRLHYDAGLFEERRMDVLLEQYAFLLRQICEDPLRPVGSYSLVTGASTPRLPNPAQPLEAEVCGAVHAAFLREAARAPERIAILEAGAQWTYERLASAAAALAGWLGQQNVGPGDIVAVYGHRCGALVAAMLGILEAGAAFCIVDPGYPALRLVRSLRAAKPKAWLQIEPAHEIPDALREAVEELTGNCRLTVPRKAEEIAALALGLGPLRAGMADADNPAYVTFSSGTAGDPKCILGTHRPVSHFVEWQQREFGFKRGDRFSMLSGLSHDPLLRDVFTPLSTGATLCIPTEEDIFAPGRLPAWMREQQVTVAHLTPAMARLLTESSGEETPRRPLSTLRYVFFGGEALSTHDVSVVKRLAPRAACVNFYGTSETPQAMGFHRAVLTPDRGNSESVRPVPIGRPIDGVQLLILNSAGMLCGPCELGEIQVRTPYLSQGYRNDAALTHERFRPNPFRAEPSDRLYRTGDLGRYNVDGLVEFAGRADQQIKIRGYRIELGEVEAALAGHPEIQACSVIARESGSGDRHLAGYFVTREKQRLTPEELRIYLRKHLPEYMIPSLFVALKALPLTPNGKVDRRALVLREDDRARPIQHAVAPRNDIERRLAAIWSEVLNVQNVGVFDSFFDLGGHSLSAARLIARARTAASIDLPLRCVFIHPTIAGLAKQIRFDSSTRTYRYVGEMPEWKCLVPAQPLGTRTPFFFFGGYQNPDDTLLIASKFVAYFGDDQPVYGLRPRWTEGRREQYASVQEAAREFLAEMRMVQPKGPYQLVGQCVSGIVAFEIAQQLHREGEEVSLLALLDTERPGAKRALMANLRVMRRRIRHIAEVITEILTANAESRADLARETIRRRIGLGRPKEAPLAPPEIPWELLIGYRRLLYGHSIEAYPGRLTLLVNRAQAAVDRDLGWEGVAQGGLEIHQIPGDHAAMLTEQSEAVAKVLLGCMDESRSAVYGQESQPGVCAV